MKDSIGMGVSEKIFAERFKGSITEDVYTNSFHSGEFRGRVDKNKFYFYVSGDSLKSFTTIIKGSFDGKEAEYKFTKMNYTKILISMASVLWLVFSVVMFLWYGPIGLLGLVPIPVMLVFYFNNKKSDKEQLLKKLKSLCKLGKGTE